MPGWRGLSADISPPSSWSWSGPNQKDNLVAISFPSAQWLCYRNKNTKMYPILHFIQYLISNKSQAAYFPIITIACLPGSFIFQTGKVASKFFRLGGEAVMGICHNLDLLSCKACWDLGSWSVKRQEMFSGVGSLEKEVRTDWGYGKEKRDLMNSIPILLPFICEKCPYSAEERHSTCPWHANGAFVNNLLTPWAKDGERYMK